MKKEIDYSIRIQRVMRYIEEHLDEHITLRELSRVACFSQYHFHRVFVACVGITILEYIHYRRLAKAASLLLKTTSPVMDIALLVGYETHAAFSKAFRQCYNMPPSEYRKMNGKGITHHLPEIMNPAGIRKKQNRDKQSTRIAYEIREIPEMKVLCITSKGFFQGGFLEAGLDAFTAISTYVIRNNLLEQIRHCLSIIPDIPHEFHDPDAKIHCGFSIEGDIPHNDQVDIHTIEKGRYAVFEHLGPYQNLFQTWNMAYYTCAFAGEEKLRDTPSFEIYLNSPAVIPPEELMTKIYIPVM